MNCEKCQSKMWEIVYGYPTPELYELAEQNLWLIGGCSPSPIKFYCKDCKVSWSEDFGFDS